MKKTLFLILFLTNIINANAQEYSYIWGMHFPKLVEPSEDCCFDYDNDSTPDDGLGDILLSNQGNSNFQASIDLALLNNEVIKVFDWQNLDLNQNTQSFNFGFLDAETITPNLSLVDRMSGLTQLYLPSTTTNNIFTAQLNNNLVTATAAQISGLLNLQFDSTQDLTPLTLTDVKVEVQLSLNPANVEPGVYSDDITATNPAIVGGMKIGGILASDEFLDVLDTQYRTCQCAGVDASQPLITTSTFFNTIIVSCAQSNLTPANCPANSFCSTVGDFCSNAVGLGTTFDIDTNNDNVKDAYSVALRYGAAATTIVDIIFRDGFE